MRGVPFNETETVNEIASIEAAEERISQLLVLVGELILKNQVLRSQIKDSTDNTQFQPQAS